MYLWPRTLDGIHSFKTSTAGAGTPSDGNALKLMASSGCTYTRAEMADLGYLVRSFVFNLGKMCVEVFE